MDFSAPAWNSDLTAAALPSRALFITQDQCSTAERMRSGALRSQASPSLLLFHPQWMTFILVDAEDGRSTFWCQVWIPRKRMSRGRKRTCYLNLKPVLAFMEGFYNMPPSISLAKPMLNAIPKESGESFVKNQMCLIWFIYNKSETTYEADLWLLADAHTCVITTPNQDGKVSNLVGSNINWSLGHFEQNWGLALKGRRRQMELDAQ